VRKMSLIFCGAIALSAAPAYAQTESTNFLCNTSNGNFYSRVGPTEYRNFFDATEGAAARWGPNLCDGSSSHITCSWANGVLTIQEAWGIPPIVSIGYFDTNTAVHTWKVGDQGEETELCTPTGDPMK